MLNVLVAFLALLLFFALPYALFSAQAGASLLQAFPRGLLASALSAMTLDASSVLGVAQGTGSYLLLQSLAAVEAALGVCLVGLLGFVVASRIRRA